MLGLITHDYPFVAFATFAGVRARFGAVAFAVGCS